LIESGAGDLEVWRIRRGRPRFGVDFGEDSLPAEAGLDHLVDAGKGCFLGQESVARVRNLGHPPWLVLPLVADGPVYPGATVRAGSEEVGRVTSATGDADRAFVIARVRWRARGAELRAGTGAPLTLRA
jgi:tRNA-modifying protein YgfZ